MTPGPRSVAEATCSPPRPSTRCPTRAPRDEGSPTGCAQRWSSSTPRRGVGRRCRALLDVVLEDACGLEALWRKGNAVTSADGEKLLDGTVFKPRRIFSDAGRDTLAVFTTDVERVGVGKGRRPVAQALEYLRRRELPFGLLTNGREWRLLWADTDNLAWAQWDAERWLDGETLSDELHLLRRVLTLRALSRGTAEHCPLFAAIRETRRGQAKLSRELGERVRLAVETLLRCRNPRRRPRMVPAPSRGPLRRRVPLRDAPRRGALRRSARTAARRQPHLLPRVRAPRTPRSARPAHARATPRAPQRVAPGSSRSSSSSIRDRPIPR
jgi:hypothetical protein